MALQARNAERPYLARTCLEQLIYNRKPVELPLDLLEHAVLTEQGRLQQRALSLLILRGTDAIETVQGLLKAEKAEVAETAPFMLLHLFFSVDTNEAAGTVLASVQRHYGGDKKAALLLDLDAVLDLGSRSTSYRSYRSRYAKGPAVYTKVGPSSSSTERNALELYRSARQQFGLVSPRYRWRLKEFLPLLQTAIRTGTAEEKAAAERLIFDLWDQAREQAEEAKRAPGKSRFASRSSRCRK
jgi:hypothetical protein